MTVFWPKLKKTLGVLTVFLLCCDISLLFAAQNDQSVNASAQEDMQLNQLRGQVQAQIKALNAQSSTQKSMQPQSIGASLTGPSSIPPVNFSAPSGQAMSAPVTPPASVPDTNNNIASKENTNNPIQESDVNEMAFNAMVKNSLPMSPEQILKLRSFYMASQSAAVSLPKKPARPVISSVFANLAPGTTPPVIRLAQNRVTTLLFLDSSGQPWPIESYDIGDPSVFNIQWNKTNNIMAIQPMSFYKDGNMQVTLKNLNTPVVIDLIPGQEAVDYRVDMHVPGYGPNAKFMTADTLPASRSPDLLNILEGLPPPNSQVLKVKGGDCQAWLSNGKMYVRTRLTILSPGWTATLSSADGMRAYEMHPTPSLLVSQNNSIQQGQGMGTSMLVSQNGQVMTLQVEGF